MRNKTFVLIGLFLISIVCSGVDAYADTKPEDKKPVAAVVPEAQEAKKDEQLQKQKKELESELQDTSLVDKKALDFPNRPSLGSLELAPLPGVNEEGIPGPLPVAQSVSKRDMPSEQLLGRITPEIFQEMADIERGNTFLKLQMEKERLKNDLETLKATYRQNRLDEISKREDVVRNRIQWWQEQEKVRLEIEKKQAEEQALEEEIAEQEALRDQLRKDAVEKSKVTSEEKAESDGKTDDVKTTIAIEPAQTSPMFAESYVLLSVRGVQGKLTARLKSIDDESILDVKKDDILPTGHVVKNITKDMLVVVYGNQQDQLSIKKVSKKAVDSVESEEKKSEKSPEKKKSKKEK